MNLNYAIKNQNQRNQERTNTQKLKVKIILFIIIIIYNFAIVVSLISLGSKPGKTTQNKSLSLAIKVAQTIRKTGY